MGWTGVYDDYDDDEMMDGIDRWINRFISSLYDDYDDDEMMDGIDR